MEAVASEGPVDDQRKATISRWLEQCGYSADDAVFVTAYLDRDEAVFRRTVGRIAWDSLVWFATEPDLVIHAVDGRHIASLRDLPGL